MGLPPGAAGHCHPQQGAHSARDGPRKRLSLGSLSYLREKAKRSHDRRHAAASEDLKIKSLLMIRGRGMGDGCAKFTLIDNIHLPESRK